MPFFKGFFGAYMKALDDNRKHMYGAEKGKKEKRSCINIVKDIVCF